MTHFQAPDGMRLWTRESAEEKIAIHIGKEVVLEQWGSTDAAGKSPRIQLDKEGVVELNLIERPSSDKAFEISRRKFSLKAIGEGAATLTGVDSHGQIACGPVKVFAGEFRNFQGMEKDLIADIGRGSNVRLMNMVQRLLNNDYASIFNQGTPDNISKYKSPLACGIVAKAGGEAMVGPVVSHSFEKDSSYHKPLWKLTKRDDIEYDSNFMKRIRRIIGGHVKSGRPVLVGCVYDPKPSMLKQGHLQATQDGGHSVLIVGCNAAYTEFLYVDPWFGGSNLKYTGGIKSEPYPPLCHYIGVFKSSSLEEVIGRGPVLRKHHDSTGNWLNGRYLEVISGPTR